MKDSLEKTMLLLSKAQKNIENLLDDELPKNAAFYEYAALLSGLQKAAVNIAELEIEDSFKRKREELLDECVSISGSKKEGFEILLSSFSTENNPSVRSKTDYHSYLLRSRARAYMHKRGYEMPCYKKAVITYEVTLGYERNMVDLDNVLTKYITDALEGIIYESDAANCLISQHIIYKGRAKKSSLKVMVTGVIP